jgi:hypothetical protein
MALYSRLNCRSDVLIADLCSVIGHGTLSRLQSQEMDVVRQALS